MVEEVQHWGPLGLAVIAAGTLLAFWIVQTAGHEARLRRIPIRVHVNGIRGKSTIVRYIAAALREGGIETIAKTTGSATRLIRADGSEEPIERTGAPTIIEQIEVLRRAARPSTRAIVFECMALQPDYQRTSEERMIRSTDGIIANVRRDHVEQLGASLPEIARSLSSSAPVDAPLFTAEDDPALIDILARGAEQKGGWLVPVSGNDLSREELRGFSPLSFPENIALALDVAGRHGVPRDVALRGIRSAVPDPGASKIHRHDVDGRDLFWIDLFGVNDVESAEANISRIAEWIGEQGKIVFVLNNRADRQHRTLQFAEMAARSSVAAKVFLVGENLKVLREEIVRRGSDSAVEELDLASLADPKALANRTAARREGATVLLGLANIHTKDATRLREILETEESVWDPREEAPETSEAA